MKRIIVTLLAVVFIGSLVAQAAPAPIQQAQGKNAPRVSDDKSKDKDRGKHIGEHHHHNHGHHRGAGKGKK